MRVFLGLIACVAAGGVAWADQPGSLFVHTSRPTAAEIKAAYPAPALARKVTGTVAP